ncbi:acyl-coenzyme A thioesterase 5-like isoform X2 [Homarus americanus]|uniref:acyl-coenzyme A thioesterase 5-like isoform X2 n=1 Tax=Homarus americanus TaxID=6706 RepID=UPI001C44DD1A|nr:acyl-coenzyme A thioesterase 5-like isoform X2 [Homarus americanus]
MHRSFCSQLKTYFIQTKCCSLGAVSNMSSAQPKGVEMVVEPVSCLHDEPVSIRVHGLNPGQDVTLQASMKDSKGINFLSYAHYRADSSGQVDVSKLESLGGHYKGIFPMGLIGSLVPAPNEYKYTRFFKRDVENPNIVKMTVHKGHLSDEALCSPVVGEPLATLTHLRHYMSPGVQRIPVRFGKVRGCLFLPPGNGPFPGVIDMFGSAGGLLEYRSAQLASRGFASLALAFFAYDDLPKHLEEFNIAYFEEAVEFLLKQEKVFGDGVGVIGTSKGGDLALSMAAFIPSVHACIVINCCNTPSVKGLRVRDCFYTPLNHVFRNVRVSDEGVVFGKEIAQDPRLHPESIIPIEKSQSAFLFLVGSDDQNVKSEFFAQLSYQRLRDHSYPKHYEVSSYPGAGHLIEPPYSPHTPISFHNSYALPLIWGGTSKHHTLAQVQAWSKVLDFLRVHLAKGESISKHKCALKSHL